MLHNCIDTVDLLECNGSNTIVTLNMSMVKHYSRTLEYSVDIWEKYLNYASHHLDQRFKKAVQILENLRENPRMVEATWSYGPV